MDWYADPGRDHGSWALTQAMMTIAKAHPTKGPNEVAVPTEEMARAQGRVTWLLDLQNGKPIVDHLSCPLNPVPKQFAGKDWTKYEGLLHTDHAVREEFFDGREEPLTKYKLPLLDFTYLYDSAQTEFTEFMAGRVFSDDDVYSEIGRPETWSHRYGDFAPINRTQEQATDIAFALRRCFNWQES